MDKEEVIKAFRAIPEYDKDIVERFIRKHDCIFYFCITYLTSENRGDYYYYLSKQFFLHYLIFLEFFEVLKDNGFSIHIAESIWGYKVHIEEKNYGMGH